jgi:hypothetical protein
MGGVFDTWQSHANSKLWTEGWSLRAMRIIEKAALVLGILAGLLGIWLDSSALAQLTDVQEAKQINNQVRQLYRQGRYAEAVPLAHKVLSIQEKALGPDHPDVATSLNNLAKLYREGGREMEAEVLKERAAAIRAIKR